MERDSILIILFNNDVLLYAKLNVKCFPIIADVLDKCILSMNEIRKDIL